MATAASNRNLARELMGLATEIDSLAKSLVRAQEELAREHSRRQHFEQETVDLLAAVAQARQRATVAERDLARLVTELDTKTQTAHVREHELQTRLNDADQTIERLRREVESKERQRLALETDLSDVMQNLRQAAAAAAWPSSAHAAAGLLDSDSEATHVSW